MLELKVRLDEVFDMHLLSGPAVLVYDLEH